MGFNLILGGSFEIQILGNILIALYKEIELILRSEKNNIKGFNLVLGGEVSKSNFRPYFYCGI